jgi:sarcosine oxidase
MLTALELRAAGHKVTLLEKAAPGNKNGASHGSRVSFRQWQRPDVLPYQEQSFAFWKGRTAPGIVTVGDMLELFDSISAASKTVSALERSSQAFEILDDEGALRRFGLRLEAGDVAVFQSQAVVLIHAEKELERLNSLALESGVEIRHNTSVEANHSLRPVVWAVGAWIREIYSAETIVVSGQLYHYFNGRDFGPAGFPYIRDYRRGYLVNSVPDVTGEGWKVFEDNIGPDLPPGKVRVDHSETDRVKRYAKALCPEAVYSETECCRYVCTPDFSPRIGPIAPGEIVLIEAAGSGFKMGPSYARIIREIIEGGESPFPPVQ